MDTLSYINSNAIRNHLKEIDYSFNSLESAWLIFNCNKLTYEEKKKAWLNLIDEMPDCIVAKRLNCKGWESLHDFLRQYIEIMDDEIKVFNALEEPGAFVYMYSYLYTDDQSWTEKFETVYPSLNACLQAYHNDVNDLDETNYPGSTGVIKYRIRKQSLLDTTILCEIEFNGDGQVLDILENSSRTDSNEDVINNSFDGMWFDFPTPFKKGDMVCFNTEEKNNGIFVLLGLSTWNASDFIKESGDTIDMNGHGYFVSDDGTIYREVVSNYMDFDFYDGLYQHNEKILPVLSKFIKGEIEVDFLMNAYRKVLLSVASEDVKLDSWYSQEKVNKLKLQ